MLFRSAAILVVALLVVSATGFAASSVQGNAMSPVPFDETLSTGLTGVDVQQAEEGRYVLPKAEVFYSQYEYVVGYYGIEALVDSLTEPRRTRQFGQPLAIFVTDLSGTDPHLTDERYVRLDNSVAKEWTRADEAVFVVDSGAHTSGGPAVLPFSDPSDAEQFADQYGGQVLTWSALRTRLAGDERDPLTRLAQRRADQHRWANATVSAARGLLDRPVSVVVGEDAPTLAAAVERAPPNTTVVVPPGTYQIHLTIEKPLTLVGASERTVLTGSGNGTVLTIRSPDVAVRSLHIEGVGGTNIGDSSDQGTWDDRIRLIYGRGDAGIRLADAHGALVQNVTIDTPANGVVALNSTGAVVRDCTIRGSARPMDGFMGVLAMYSKMVIEESRFVGGRDAVYTHYANGVVVRDNRMTSVRFGLHEMYTSDALVANNTVSDAEVGLIVMTRPARNALVDNRVRSAEIGISTAGSASFVAENVVTDSSVGISIGTDRSVYARNTLVDNHVGLRVATLLPTNAVLSNDVVGNDRPVTVGTRGARNIWATNGRGNYWGEVPGFDRDGDGVVDRSYRPASPVDHNGDRAGGYALARSPAVGALRQFQRAVPGLRGASVVDTAPLAEPVRPEALDRLRKNRRDR